MTAPDNPLSELFALEALAREATPGEWTAFGCHIECWPEDAGDPTMSIYDEGGHSEADAAYIAAAHPARLLRIIAAVRELERDFARLLTLNRICDREWTADEVLDLCAIEDRAGKRAARSSEGREEGS